ncbi:CocE/NonD family hydrolase [Cytophagaceae bacterium DM2B3-1]|uniref:CocE/NonD family hydrolase n=1 Tax=Xanthocytophaga flava TaxID=3048013 RepID=A0ABT7CQH3_9BACT|nr:CocE/NonD family hydrolase [Xanthocytophaga flavus]MDJ1495956.1 CocE/NonD family hydrolase [Xanthocytophaga flavus]
MKKKLYAFLFFVFLGLFFTDTFAQTADTAFVRNNYQKYEYQIPMRDGIKLFTIVYVPKDASDKNKYPMIMQRTCYSVAPYGPNAYSRHISPSDVMMREKYIVVYQDVRGRYMSEGTWTNMTPHHEKKDPKKDKSIDEASDTYDTIDWLLKNVKYNNGRVGQWGISYPGFYTIAGALSQHPALKASSPQAPVSDFYFDDFHHNGAFTEEYFLTYPLFGIQHPAPTSKDWFADKMIAPIGARDGYDYYMKLGPLKNGNKYYADNFFWQETVEHPNYDEFWQKRSIVPHLKNVKHAVLTVGGWFDAEDLYGPLTIYKTLEKNNPGIFNVITMGPFGHGRWSRETGHTLHGDIYFGDSVATFYQREIEGKFFHHFLKDKGDGKVDLPEAWLFDTGTKEYKKFDKYPSPAAKKTTFYFQANGKLATSEPGESQSFSEYISDPMKPVPSSEEEAEMFGFTPFKYMSGDQRFAASRPDVLVFQTDVLDQDITLGGEIMAKLKISTTGSDADFFVKLVDVYPDNEPNHKYMPNKNVMLASYQQMVRSEIMRARFRNSFSKPEPLTPGQVTEVNFRLQDVLHTFKKGHRIMIQVQSSCFPVFDRNPQKYVENIYKANEEDFIKATQRVYHQKGNASVIEADVLN